MHRVFEARNPDRKVRLRSYEFWSYGPRAKVEGAHIGEKELISDLGIERTVTLDSRKSKTPNPILSREKVTIKCRRP
jgi:hypothetical protein